MSQHREFLEVIDDSHLHEGHAGAASGQGHFTVVIQCKTLSDLPKVKAHQLIYQALGGLMHQEIHALSIRLV
jgi:BolA family transcriptional regulator, general stress-responsive regulator